MKKYQKPDPRCYQLNLSLTLDELEDVKRRALAIGMRPVHFARAAVTGRSAPSVALVVSANQPFRLIHIQLVRLGNNLNQLARKFHETQQCPPADLVPLLKDIRALIARIPQ
jgi:hypothetical protein